MPFSSLELLVRFEVDFDVVGNDSNLLICDVFNCGQLEGLSLMKLGSLKTWYMIMLFRRSLSIFELCSIRRVQGN